MSKEITEVVKWYKNMAHLARQEGKATVSIPVPDFEMFLEHVQKMDHLIDQMLQSVADIKAVTDKLPKK